MSLKKYLATVLTTDGQTNVAEIAARNIDQAKATIAGSQAWMFKNSEGSIVCYFQHAVTRIELNPTPVGSAEEPRIIAPNNTLAIINEHCRP